ncbi:MAG: DNA polymerase III subunit delta' [Bacteroidota bacterium]
MRFKDIIGQDEAVKKVQETIENKRLAHGLLLVGPSGVGKLAMATAIAQYMNCLQPVNGDSCGKCSSCIKISKGIHPDLTYILPIFSKTEGGKRLLSASYFDQFREPFFEDPYFSFSEWQRTLGGENKQLFISVHEIRELKRKIYLKAFEGKYKVVIVWNAEKINVEGANAFLKLLEEPPDKTLIILTCSDPSMLLTTINSRVQRIMMSRLSQDHISQYLMDKRGFAQEEAESIARISDGSIAEAREVTTDGSKEIGRVYADWMRAIYKGDYAEIQSQLEQVARESKEFQKLFLEIAIKKMRDALLFHLGLDQLSLATEEEKKFQENFAKVIDSDKVERMVWNMEDTYRAVSRNANSQMTFTALSLRMHSIIRS